MSTTVAVSACPLSTDLEKTPPPSPDTLAYSFTLPAGPASSRVARAATRVVLQTHGLDDMTDAAVQVVAELAACACRFTPDVEVYMSLRYREGALRVILYDGHPRHVHPRLVAACDARRRAALRVLGCVVRACEGEWGFGEAREPGGGTRMWAVLPGWGARGYVGVG
ncbi:MULTISPECIES: ATP-binding protein [unclassified Streptomyces]|uniref:ATP-binding protein n=1 Tax=unclassified Streptomyces TaxID=2593676 RepID=UPI002E803854|nr:ATP-binding protein [Streptomyces sp. NBC_00589]WTI36177.1 ATP-binding protein [Streptomyces sp. NBC_00775]WUB30148.1 ATP-binding protein [Streptomyces sp. NBC_00589]